jgi:hypothetical protein
MSKRARAVVNPDGKWTHLNNVEPGTYALYPVGEQVYTLEEVMDAYIQWKYSEAMFRSALASLHQPAPAHPTEVLAGDVWQWNDEPLRTVGRVDGNLVVFAGYGTNICILLLDPASGWRLVSRAGKAWPVEAPAPDLPEGGSWWWCAGKGLARVVHVLTSQISLLCADDTADWCDKADWPGSWEPVVTCCGEGCYYFRKGFWYLPSGKTIAPKGTFTPCRRVLGVDANGQPTVSDILIPLGEVRSALYQALGRGSNGEGALGSEHRWVDEKVDALAHEPLGEGG